MSDRKREAKNGADGEGSSQGYAIAGVLVALLASLALYRIPHLFNKLGQSATQISDVDREAWILKTHTFQPNHYQAASYVANGYFGQTLPAEGTGFWAFRKGDGSPDLNGWPLDQTRTTFGTITGFWNLQDRVTHPILWENVERGGESVISGIPTWTGLVVSVLEGGSYKPGVDPATVLQYSQSQSIRNGVVTTNATWQPEEGSLLSPVQLNYTVLAHQERLNLGLVRLDVTVRGPVKLRVTDVLDGQGATRAHFSDKGYEEGNVIWTSVKPWGVEETSAYVVSKVRFQGLSMQEMERAFASRSDATRHSHIVSQHMASIAQSWDIELERDEIRTFSVTKHVGIASTDAFPHRAQAAARDTAVRASEVAWEQLVQEHTESWDRIWDDADIIVPRNDEVQITLRAALFHLMSNTISGDLGSESSEDQGSPSNLREMSRNSIPVGGLTSDSYAGLIFWDADVWMYPSLLALHPPRARPILDYRQRLLHQAEENSQLYSRPGALYPWTSGRYGNCTGTGVCALYQYHLNTDIAMGYWNYYLQGAGDDEWLRDVGWPVMRSVAEMFAEYVKFNEETGKYETRQLGEPDEFAYDINNGAYTNVGIKLLLGEWVPQAAKILNITSLPANWSDIARDIKIPYDEASNILVGYDNMDPLVRIKQASVTLISYPLNWRMNDDQPLNDMTFYSRATTPDGPAMTWAIYAINALHLHRTGCAAYTYLLQSSQPYIRGPFSQFSEQRTDTWSWTDAAAGQEDERAAMLREHLGTAETAAAFPFLTGYGGYLQIFTHGFTGMRADIDGYEVIDGKKGPMRIVLVVDPVMVPQFPDGLRIKGIKFHGAVLDFNIGPRTTTISRRGGRHFADGKTINVKTQGRGVSSEYRHYTLDPGDAITIPTRRPDLDGPKVPGNFAQCAPISSITPPDGRFLQGEGTSAGAGWIAGRHPVAAVDGSPDTVWQPASPEESSVLIDLGQVKLVSAVMVNWADSPAEKLLVEGFLNGEEENAGWVTMLQVGQVSISSPYDPHKPPRIALPDANVTSASFDRSWNVSKFRVTMKGTQGVDKNVGATVAEISIL